MKFMALFVGCFFLAPAPVFAQSVRGGSGFFYGGHSVWPGLLNAVRLSQPTVPISGNDYYIVLGAEIQYRTDRWLIGGTASALVNKQLSGVNTHPELVAAVSNAHLWIGRIVWNSKRARLYPSLGPGLNSVNVNSTAADGTLTIHVLDGFSTDLCLTFDWLIDIADEDPTLTAGPMLSLRAGYRLTTASAEWHGDQQTPTTLSPSRYTPYGFYVTLGFGGGGFRRR